MNNVVKLILTCQVKDDIIPQLIPLMWINSIVVSLLILLILINIFHIKSEYILIYTQMSNKEELIWLLW